MEKRPYLIIIFLVFLAIALPVLLFWPKYQNLRTLQLIVQQGEENLKREKEYFDEITKIHKELENHKEVLVKTESALPNDPCLASLFDYFQKTAAQTRLSLREIDFAGVTVSDKNPEIKEINISMSLTGDYYPYFKGSFSEDGEREEEGFLSVIENSARLFTVNEVSFASPQDPRDKFSFKINLKTYGY